MSTAVVLGTRPELIKMAPVLLALDELDVETQLIHSGQHYDEPLSKRFIDELQIRTPDVFLGVGSGSQAYQTAESMFRLEKALSARRPDSVLVQGDTNTVLAGALTASKMGIEVGHVEAGLRSNDRRMPEEYNRRVADHVSNILFAPTPQAVETLESERVWGEIHMTGNTVIDACERYVKVAEQRSRVMESIPFDDFILVTAHRAENVDNRDTLAGLVRVLVEAPLPIVYPIHPRTVKMLQRYELYQTVKSSSNLCLLPPVGYFDFLLLMKRCRFILTDSGGIQEEATSPSIKKRVLVFRDATERPEAVDSGYARVVGTLSDGVASALRYEVDNVSRPDAPSPYGDGMAGQRIAKVVMERA